MTDPQSTIDQPPDEAAPPERLGKPAWWMRLIPCVWYTIDSRRSVAEARQALAAKIEAPKSLWRSWRSQREFQGTLHSDRFKVRRIGGFAVIQGRILEAPAGSRIRVFLALPWWWPLAVATLCGLVFFSVTSGGGPFAAACVAAGVVFTLCYLLINISFHRSVRYDRILLGSILTRLPDEQPGSFGLAVKLLGALAYMALVAVPLSVMSGQPYLLVLLLLSAAAVVTIVIGLYLAAGWALKDAKQSGQFRISSLLLVTFLLAVYFALLRYLLPREDLGVPLDSGALAGLACFGVLLLLVSVPALLMLAEALIWLAARFVRSSLGRRLLRSKQSIPPASE